MQNVDRHPDIKTGRTGLLLISLGTPDAPTYGAVRRYLAEFLGDRRVVNMPRALWLPILYGPILTFRPLKARKLYAKIWDNERGESPLRTTARAQAEAMADRLGEDVVVDWAFTYGTPSTEAALTRLKDQGCDRIVLFALYPQYSSTTTAAAYDRAFAALSKMQWQPAVRTVPAYYKSQAYIDALATSVKSALADLTWEPEAVLASYHSIPQSYWEDGDPYPCQCQATSRRLANALGWSDTLLKTSYQSRVGPKKWVGPYSDKTVEELARSGIKKLAVLAPAFSADCLETLEEIDMQFRKIFLAAGGTDFHYIPCLNDSRPGMDALEAIARQELSAWI